MQERYSLVRVLKNLWSMQKDLRAWKQVVKEENWVSCRAHQTAYIQAIDILEYQNY